MLKLKNQFKIISIYLFVFIGLLFINMNQVMAMQNNKNKQTSEKEPTNEEVDCFFNLLKKQKEIIQTIKLKHPHLKDASFKEIEEWICLDINPKNKLKSSDKKRKAIDLNTIPNEKDTN
ncbi:SVM family protein [Candidatus Phytoplasma fraxini]|uniref:SVM family protein n=1 Tax=Ash yellows phytoplasma TaxID=35780 RepID=A0ABZ2U844_ASHYP